MMAAQGREAGVEVESIALTLDGRAVLTDVSFRALRGQVTGLLGPNGAGKSSLLKVITGLLRPTHGTVEVLGRAAEQGVMPAGVGGLIEEPGFYPWLSARANLVVAAAGRPEREERVDEVLEQAGLGDRAGDKVSRFSQGMRQRLGVARCLLGSPAVLILDEPTNGLDPAGYRWVREIVSRQRDQGAAVLISSHVLSEVELLSDAVVILADGEVVASGPTAEVIAGCRSLEEFFFSLTSDEPQ